MVPAPEPKPAAASGPPKGRNPHGPMRDMLLRCKAAVRQPCMTKAKPYEREAQKAKAPLPRGFGSIYNGTTDFSENQSLNSAEYSNSAQKSKTIGPHSC